MLLSSVFLPLYIPPSGLPPDTSTWSPIFRAITTNPSRNFTIIVNPASGPGPSPYPSPAYVAHIAQLNSYPSVRTLGYVHCSYATRPIAAVSADISIYDNWATYPGADIHMDGIFFDEAPNKTTALTLSYMQSAATAVQLAFPPRHSIVMTNPGVQVDARFYASADYINVFENTYAAYTPAAMAGTPPGLENKATFMVHTFTGDEAAQQQIVERAGRGGYAGWLVTTADDYDSFSELWDELCAGITGERKLQH